MFVRQTEMEADDLRMELHHEIAHFVVEGSPAGAWSGDVVINRQFDEVGIQASSPAHFAGVIVPRQLVTEEVCMDGARCLAADGFKLLTRLFHAQEGAS